MYHDVVMTVTMGLLTMAGIVIGFGCMLFKSRM